MEMNRPAVDATGNGEFKQNQLCSLLDELVAARWDLNQRLRDSADLPTILTTRLRRVGDELDIKINAIKTLVGLPF